MSILTQARGGGEELRISPAAGIIWESRIHSRVAVVQPFSRFTLPDDSLNPHRLDVLRPLLLRLGYRLAPEKKKARLESAAMRGKVPLAQGDRRAPAAVNNRGGSSSSAARLLLLGDEPKKPSLNPLTWWSFIDDTCRISMQELPLCFSRRRSSESASTFFG